ncbi:SIMPL domain-containing protein [Capnocytophaga sp. H4358]|uniref:SIMPL domain-containing protein n=1 Tax=Capnocytophaga sp. H4358 TaxID=1945658 RepID=UPI000BB19804|nr:SIMPL domain-containing protein [Capnocytophaga sp. H4358]ATA71911.1 SIMPL domain-containing protein [Capnocytophaga sp. H4358]
MKSFLLILFFIPLTMIAQSVPSVTVVGEGVVTASPDIVYISLNVENEGDNVKHLKKVNEEAVAKVLHTLADELPKSNFQTSHVSLRKHYNYEKHINKYYISQGINIKLEDISKYEWLMECLFEAGVNEINSVTFDVKDREKFIREAQSLAIYNARQKALFYAVSLEQNIGKALFISELNSNAPRFENVAMFAKNDVMNSTIAVGVIEIRANVNISFELLKE